MQCMESNSVDKKNWMSSAQLWITGNDYDYKKEDSASEATLVIFKICKCYDLSGMFGE